MDFTWTPAQQSLREQARSVAVSAVERFGRANDSWINGWSKEFALELGELGWIGLTWPTEFGGGGRPPIERLIIGEELIKVGAPIGSMWFADRQMGPTLITYGRPDQQAEFLPSILTGASTWCIGMSEPNAGSDLASLKTQAVLDGLQTLHFGFHLPGRQVRIRCHGQHHVVRIVDQCAADQAFDEVRVLDLFD